MGIIEVENEYTRTRSTSNKIYEEESKWVR